ncbi:transcription initiation factor IIA subunit 2-like [Teleopsis dalmanni]|uniref:transcription initiation factor IIA subunit 2-like n=1 Tax=Teleopsis dalmanni TaxID=139649 RepID=UPI000D32BB1E|nr:transcription initiation factor IIA subunit 2-like [Teleopsis dalmanni]
MSYQLYRNTTLGYALQDTLDEQIQQGKISPALASKVLGQFDKSVVKMLGQSGNAKCVFKANKLNNYRFCDNVWSLFLKDVEFREAERSITADKVKIVACDGRRNKSISQDDFYLW